MRLRNNGWITLITLPGCSSREVTAANIGHEALLLEPLPSCPWKLDASLSCALPQWILGDFLLFFNFNFLNNLFQIKISYIYHLTKWSNFASLIVRKSDIPCLLCDALWHTMSSVKCSFIWMHIIPGFLYFWNDSSYW